MTLDEDITAASVSEIKDEILGQLDGELSEVHLDLTNVEMVDSTGISLLISIQNSLKKKSGCPFWIIFFLFNDRANGVSDFSILFLANRQFFLKFSKMYKKINQ